VGQTLDSRLEQLRQAGCSSRNIYREKATGARPDRRELNRMLGKLAPGDVVTVTRIDRLARSTFDLFGIVKRIVDAKAQFRSLAEPWADTGTSTGRLMLARAVSPAGCRAGYPGPRSCVCSGPVGRFLPRDIPATP
jgi:DNA invertase Pin-like site-specific DNA recombinase